MEIVVRASVIYWLLWLLVRGSGKRALAELSPLELILAVVLGDIVQQGITQEDMSITGAFLAAGTFVAWALFSGGVARHWRRATPLLEGQPIIVVFDGEPLVPALKEQGLSLDDLREAAREHGIGHLSEVKVAVAEPDGSFSFIRKKQGDEEVEAKRPRS
jgi:uncharacterized membrane protein YcaP (DUF421 family)